MHIRTLSGRPPCSPWYSASTFFRWTASDCNEPIRSSQFQPYIRDHGIVRPQYDYIFPDSALGERDALTLRRERAHHCSSFPARYRRVARTILDECSKRVFYREEKISG